jgi:hypothetical protein
LDVVWEEEKMLNVDAKDGSVKIRRMEGTEKRLVADIGSIAHKTMLLIANDGAESADEVYLKYGTLAHELVNYIETTVQRVNEIQNCKGKD